MELDKLNILLEKKGIIATELVSNTKASEEYVNVKFIQMDKFVWEGYVPYQYRRTGLHIETEEELAKYLISIKPYFVKNKMDKWVKDELKFWETKKTGAAVTFSFFKAICSLKWTSNFPSNNNPQRRIQDIKELGYTLSTRLTGQSTERLLLPIPRGAETGYETFTPQFKSRVIRLLKGINAFEAKATNIKALIPDHKFSEIRWDESTRAENSMEMTDEEIIEKFQLLDNQRNQQKREICRKCFQTSERGEIYGIKYFYKGSKQWNKSIPTKGKEAEKGCIGCPWHDIPKWREELNKILKKK